MDISVKIDTPRSRGSKYNLAHRVASILRMRGGTLIGIPDNALGSGNPNLLSSPEFAGGLADAPTRGGLVTLANIAGYDNAIAFGHDGVTTSYAYKSFTPTVALTYTLSVIVKMDDGNAPTFTQPANVADVGNTFAININATAIGPGTYTVSALPDGTYRVSAPWTVPTAWSHFGIVKYNTNNNRTFKVTGYKLELGSVATPYTPQSILRQRGTYQDSTGTMPLTAVGEVLGLLTDRLGAVGPELFTGTYSTGANTTATYNGAEATATFGGHITTTGANWLYTPANPVGIGTLVNIEFDAQWVSGSDLVVGAGWTAGRTITAAENGGVKRRYFVPVAALHINSSPATFGSTLAGAVWKITIISIRVVTGNHATQPTPANKPTLVRVPKRLGSNQVTNGTFDVDTSGWTSAGGVHTWVAGALRRTTGQGDAGSYQDVSGLTPGKSYRFRPKMSNITLVNGVAAYVYVGPGFGALIGSVLGTTQIPLVFTATSSTVRVYLYTNSTSAADFDDIEVCEVLEWTNAISFDGSNDFLQTGITTGNEGWLCAGVTFGGTASTNETIFANGAGSAPQRGVWLVRDGTSSGVNNSFRMGVGNGTALTMITTTALPLIGTPRVVEGGWTASSVFVGVDGNIMTTARTGDATPAPQSSLIGCYAAGFHTMQGPMTAFLHCQTVPTPEECDIIRKWMASTNRATYWGELPTLSLDFVSGDYLISNGEV